MERIKSTHREVLAILDQNPDARDSDDVLYYYICRQKLLEKGYAVSHMIFSDVWLFLREYGIPPYETVRRTRQKIQQHHPELRANADVQAMREVKEEEYKNYARSINV